MTKRNPLAAILGVRAIKERQARSALGAARRQQEQARQRLSDLRDRLTAELPITELLTPHQLRVLHLQGIRSEELLREASVAYEAARRETEVHADQWRRAKSDLDAAEKLESKRSREKAHRAMVVAERALDDLAGLRRRRRSA